MGNFTVKPVPAPAKLAAVAPILLLNPDPVYADLLTPSPGPGPART